MGLETKVSKGKKEIDEIRSRKTMGIPEVGHISEVLEYQGVNPVVGIVNDDCGGCSEAYLLNTPLDKLGIRNKNNFFFNKPKVVIYSEGKVNSKGGMSFLRQVRKIFYKGNCIYNSGKQ